MSRTGDVEARGDMPVGTSLDYEVDGEDSVEIRSAKHRRYHHHLLGVVAKNTGGKQPPMMSTTSLVQTCSRSGVEDPKTRLKVALRRGDLVGWTEDGDKRVCLATLHDIRAAIAEENQRETPNVEKLDHLASVARRLRGADD